MDEVSELLQVEVSDVYRNDRSALTRQLAREKHI
jgi:hypothetical protein